MLSVPQVDEKYEEKKIVNRFKHDLSLLNIFSESMNISENIYEWISVISTISIKMTNKTHTHIRLEWHTLCNNNKKNNTKTIPRHKQTRITLPINIQYFFVRMNGYSYYFCDTEQSRIAMFKRCCMHESMNYYKN